MSKLPQDKLLAALRANPRISTDGLLARPEWADRSTLKHAISELKGHIVSLGALDQERHALRRQLRGLTMPIPLYRVDGEGHGSQIGVLDLVYPEGSALITATNLGWPLPGESQGGWFDGLPYPLMDIRPQGFLGRHVDWQHILGFLISGNPEDWTDDELVHALVKVGHDLPGNLILGDASYQRFISANKTLLSDAELEEAYPRLAEINGGERVPIALLGGEFPKFTASRIIAGQPTDVLVKFTAADESAATQRWADLLICEHLALETLSRHLDVKASVSRVYHLAGRTFLEVGRFDRHGLSGRSATCSLGSLNAALLGVVPTTWPKVAARLCAEGWLSGEQVEQIERVWWFGRLIANSDMHEGNLSFRPGLLLAPIYDMLPMFYAPMKNGVVLERPYAPELPPSADEAVWQHSAKAATHFWQLCADDLRISQSFQKICRQNVSTLSNLRGQLA
ncbi:type II toxin-antitoxin system HipA family toxin YjjJ [Silvimonas amylolytica]|uniref:type II toxin-antitoxin system HipA family toxin YjjJ n=1 Tax=Silvimonas amylolytica TaxID=449663 RepID=UPI00166D48E8|nr:type II toxin-antitoxin system HipA family toxin YjjJ [Silvimonas amylolytica]